MGNLATDKYLAAFDARIRSAGDVSGTAGPIRDARNELVKTATKAILGTYGVSREDICFVDTHEGKIEFIHKGNFVRAAVSKHAVGVVAFDRRTSEASRVRIEDEHDLLEEQGHRSPCLNDI